MLNIANIENKCVWNRKSTWDVNILGLIDVKQTVNTPTVIDEIMNNTIVNNFIMCEWMHK